MLKNTLINMLKNMEKHSDKEYNINYVVFFASEIIHIEFYLI